MEGNISSGNMISGGDCCGGLDFQGSRGIHHQQQNLLTIHQHHSLPRQGLMTYRSAHENFPRTMANTQDCNQSISLADFTKLEGGKFSASDEDEPSFTEEATDGHCDANRGKKGILPWQRVKWTEKMVRILITAVSYLGEDAAVEYGNMTRRKSANLQKKGKWKSVSKVMAGRGHCVSPQQCEDKFNDLNKRYKRLNEILGRGTSCEVVERPQLLDVMDHISEKAKEEVRKILSSKHLFYEEMCSYHNGNQLHLPHDPDLQRSMWLTLRSSRDDADDQDEEIDDHDEFEENHFLPGGCSTAYGVHVGSAKRTKHCYEDISLASTNLECNTTFSSYPLNTQGNMNQVPSESEKANLLQNQGMKHRLLQLEEHKLQIQAQMLELEKERFKWQKFCRKRDRVLETMRMENERMKLETEHIALELKRKAMGADHK